MLQCEVIGCLGADAEIKELSGKKYVSFNVASTENVKDSTGNKVEQTVWVSVLWYGDGGGVFPFLKKGTKLFVRGRLSSKIYSDSKEIARVSLSVYANEVFLCGGKE